MVIEHCEWVSRLAALSGDCLQKGDRYSQDCAYGFSANSSQLGLPASAASDA